MSAKQLDALTLLWAGIAALGIMMATEFLLIRALGDATFWAIFIAALLAAAHVVVIWGNKQ